jgi:Uma2 family endonuclease
MGIREMWLIDPEKKEVEVRSFEASKNATYNLGQTLRSEIVPRIQIPILALFS